MKLRQWCMILDLVKEKAYEEQKAADTLQAKENAFEKKFYEAETPGEEEDLARAMESIKMERRRRRANVCEYSEIIREIENKEI